MGVKNSYIQSDLSGRIGYLYIFEHIGPES